ncbi:hypothetical protein [Paenibacillus hemerocallicola]|nr:hypothetical protein [Paenibacillus hemerocallicola]
MAGPFSKAITAEEVKERLEQGVANMTGGMSQWGGQVKYGS